MRPPPSPPDAHRRPRATPEWPYGKLIIVITYEEHAAASRPWKDCPPPPSVPNPGIEIASALRLVNRSVIPINLPRPLGSRCLERSYLLEQAFRRKSTVTYDIKI